jgi:hypothetical protein
MQDPRTALTPAVIALLGLGCVLIDNPDYVGDGSGTEAETSVTAGDGDTGDGDGDTGDGDTGDGDGDTGDGDGDTGDGDGDTGDGDGDTGDGDTGDGDTGDGDTGDGDGDGGQGYYGDCPMNDECLMDEYCFHDQMDDYQVCSQNCGNLGDCPDLPNHTIQCILINANLQKRCFISCENGNLCPDGMYCQSENLGIDHICVFDSQF